jgi:hypothetical protein
VESRSKKQTNKKNMSVKGGLFGWEPVGRGGEKKSMIG